MTVESVWDMATGRNAGEIIEEKGAWRGPSLGQVRGTPIPGMLPVHAGAAGMTSWR